MRRVSRDVSRVLVTGANGFVGRALVEELLKRGESVTAAVRRGATFPPGVRLVRVGDLGPMTNWSEALADCAVVVHCAARVHLMPDDSADALAAHWLANVEGTECLARQAAMAGVCRFILLSSIKVNGERTQPDNPFSERDQPAPVDSYGRSKASAEERLRIVAKKSGFEVVVIRPPLVYGPAAKANFRNMVQWLARGIPLPFGRITQNRRSLVAIDNLIDLVVTCVRHPAAANEVFLVGDGEDLSTTELLRRTAAALGVRAWLIPVPLMLLSTAAALVRRPDLMLRLGDSLQVDITKARERLGWIPPVSVDEGLRRAVDDFRRRGGNQAKRALDIVLAIVAAVLLFIPIVLIALLVRMTSRGPVL